MLDCVYVCMFVCMYTFSPIFLDVPADSTVVIEKPINLGAGDKLESQASSADDIDVFASILEMT